MADLNVSIQRQAEWQSFQVNTKMRSFLAIIEPSLRMLKNLAQENAGIFN